MKNLNKDEKKYINDKIQERVDAVMSKYDKTSMDELTKKDILSKVEVKNAIKFLETIVSKDLISKHSKFNYNRTKGIFEFYNDAISIKIAITLSPTTIDKINKIDKIDTFLFNLRYNRTNLKLEEYYILFSTWVAPSSERLNKINELIELICKDLNI